VKRENQVEPPKFSETKIAIKILQGSATNPQRERSRFQGSQHDTETILQSDTVDPSTRPRSS
jgi:hypothetical protein